MIQKKFIEPLKKYGDLVLQNPNKSIFFLKSASDEEIQQIGACIGLVYGSNIISKASQGYDDKQEGFLKDLFNTYRIKENRFLDKRKGDLLHSLLCERNELTATEFLKIAQEKGLL